MWQEPNEAKTKRGTNLTRQKPNVAAKTHCGKNPLWQIPTVAKTHCGKNPLWQKPNVAAKTQRSKNPLWHNPTSELGLQTYQ